MIGAAIRRLLTAAKDIGAVPETRKVNGRALTADLDLKLDPYPVGSIYLSADATSPAALFGGEWAQIEGKFILAASSAYKAGTSGGAASVTSGASSAANTGGTAITAAQMPPHNHNIYTEFGTNTAPVNPMTDTYMQIAGVSAGSRVGKTNVIANTGSGQAHAHTMAHTHTVATMPPYLAVYVWRRTA